MLGFSVTRMPFSSRMALQRGSTLSLINTVWMEIGAMIEGVFLSGCWSQGAGCLVALVSVSRWTQRREVALLSDGFEWFFSR